jgi:hypothetical protein
VLDDGGLVVDGQPLRRQRLVVDGHPRVRVIAAKAERAKAGDRCLIKSLFSAMVYLQTEYPNSGIFGGRWNRKLLV